MVEFQQLHRCIIVIVLPISSISNRMSSSHSSGAKIYSQMSAYFVSKIFQFIK